jgi:hypothetical protein
MQEPTQQQLKPKSSAGFRPVVPPQILHGAGHSAKNYVAIAAGLGLLVGVGAALTTAHLKAPAPSSVLAATSVGSSASFPASAFATVTTPSLLRQVEGDRKAAAKPSLVVASVKKSSLKSRKKHRLHKLVDWKLRHGAKRKPYVPEKPAAEEEENKPTALQLATAAAAQGPFFLAIQGDVTVADFDAATGTIVTYEGEKYVLAKANTDVSSIQWENFPFNVHYTCNETGACTLSHDGASAIARLAR